LAIGVAGERGIGLRIRVFANARALARTLGRDIARRLSDNPRLVLGLPTGRTPIPFYHDLVRLYCAGGVDFSRATTFNVDEFLGLESGDPRSYRAFMQRHLFDHVNIARRRIHFLNGGAPDVARECAGYDRAIERAGGIDVQILGLGVNGHIGFNEPGRALIARTHRTRLTPATRRANASLFGNRASAVPRDALSIATGASKARCVERMVNGPVTTRLPASFLQLHANAEVWVDRAAAPRN
jgi:glucosamine-6-phosphate deaminase